MGNISMTQLLIVLAIVVVIFGTKKLRSMGSDLGGAVKGFKDAVSEKDEEKTIEQDSNTVSKESTQQKSSSE